MPNLYIEKRAENLELRFGTPPSRKEFMRGELWSLARDFADVFLLPGIPLALLIWRSR